MKRHKPLTLNAAGIRPMPPDPMAVAGVSHAPVTLVASGHDPDRPLLKLDLACGQAKREGFLGVDHVATEATDYVTDLLTFPWHLHTHEQAERCRETGWACAARCASGVARLADASVEEAHCSHFLEHIPLADTSDGTDLLIAFMNELHRVLISGGKVTIITPWAWNTRAWQDPTHRRVITDATFLYFNKGWRTQNKLDHYPITTDFDFAPSYILDMGVAQRHEETRAFWMRHYVNAVNDLQVVLTKR